jgi:branched-chain amino acid transport system substrate-binding protein
MSITRTAAVILLAWAASAVAAGDLVIGQVAQLKEPASIGNQLRAGIQLYLDAVNATGGVHGNRLVLVARSRGADGADSVAKTRELLQESRPIALTGFVGTTPMEALVEEKVLDKAGVPLVGVRTGSPALHSPVQPFIFHTRASYAQELEKIARHLATIGHRKVAVFHEKSVFGLEGNALARNYLKARQLQLVGSASYDVNSTDVKVAVAEIARLQPDAVIAVANSPATAEFYKQLRAVDSRAFVVALSTTDGAVVAKRIGKQAQGLAIAQVIPDGNSKTSLLAREMQEHQRRFAPEGEINQGVAEGYVMARVLVEGLRRAGPSPTPARLKLALEGLRQLDLGGFRVSFSQASHSGSSFVDIAVMNHDGRMLR